MKKILLCCFLPFVLLLFMSSRRGSRDVREESAIGCGPSGSTGILRPDAEGRYAPAFTGWGHYHYPISTTVDSAQYYFDQGLNLYYSYHLKESLASFKEAARKDSNCAMVYWGQALAMGPYYNDSYYYKMPPQVLPVLARMRGLAVHAPAKEQDLIAAMNQKYSDDTADSQRPALNRAYSESIQGLIKKYPNDVDIKALYIDGMMIEHAWDMWDTKGEPKPWTPELVKYCKEILAVVPTHPAALHYHIHLMEASHHPEETLSSADKLAASMPGVAHMVHMASHTYQRTGYFEKGVAINDSANAAQTNYLQQAPQLQLTKMVIHYYAVEAYCAMSGAMYEKAMQAASQCERIAATNPSTASGLYLQYLYMMPAFVQVRMGKWEEILARPVPDSKWSYASLLSDYARGLAYVNIGKLIDARRSLDSLKDKLRNPVLTVRRLPGNAPIEGATVAEGILEGELLFAEKKTDAAMAAFDRAIQREDNMYYMEPKDWLLPARHYAAARLRELGRTAEAEKMHQEDMVHNPGSRW
ncbi:MAG: hypothetical protein JST68_10970 [Bacteroidetes bacterium]|nr:hypothetical protein [Bacteroidota bacterium]